MFNSCHAIWSKMKIITLGLLFLLSLGMVTMTYQTEIKSIHQAYGELQNSTNLTNQGEFQPTKKTSMILEDTEVKIAPGKIVKAWAFNGTVPGPTLRFTEGDKIVFYFLTMELILIQCIFMEFMMTKMMEYSQL